MIDRKTGPKIHTIRGLKLPPIDMYTLPNGVKVCEVNQGSQEIVKFDIYNCAGRVQEDFPLASRAVSSLLKDGTTTKNSAQLAEAIDYYGASIKTASNMDFAYTTLFSLTKHCEQVLPIIHDMHYHPTFVEEELEKFKRLNIQKLKEELTKNDVITYRQITEDIFGHKHPYGYNSLESDYNDLNRNVLVQHHNNYYGTNNTYIFLSGKITDKIRHLIADLFGTDSTSSVQKPYSFEVPTVAKKQIFLKSKNEHQSAIKLGRRLFNRSHEDHPAFFVLNTIFGGYFGSRLMMSIREDLGYTYDIFSNLDQMVHDGCFYISTEADPEYTEPIISEIYHQMDILKQEKVGYQELNMVQNYLMGTFMNMLDGPINVASLAKSMILSGKTPQDFMVFVDALISVSKDDIMYMAQKYFDPADMIEVSISPEG